MSAIKHTPFMSLPLALCLASSGLAHIKAADISFLSVRIVDYRNQQEHAAPRSTTLEELIGRAPADQSTSAIPAKKTSDRPERLLLRVEFHSNVDLQAIANRDAVIFLHSYFCSHQNDFAVLSAPTVYFHGIPIHAESMPHSTDPSSQGFTYYFYLNAVRRENRASKPMEMGFDLRVTPEDVCFYVTGSGALGLIYTSSTVVVPKEAIVAAINQLPAS